MSRTAQVVALAISGVLACALGQSPQTASRPATQPASGPAAFIPFVFIHAGDPELGSPDLEGTAKRLGLLAQRANRIGAALVVIAGDLAHGGAKPAELAALDETLTRLNMPVQPVPGNHDDLKAFRKRFGADCRAFTFNNCQFVCLNSNDLSTAQLSWLEDQLANARRQGRTHIFVVMHHPPEGVKRLDELFVKHGVEAVLCGHLHKTGQIPHTGYTTYYVSGTGKVRDANGLRYRVFKVYRDRIEQESVLLDKEVEKITLSTSMPATSPAR